MADPPAAPRMYTDLAAWWPLISPTVEYAEEATYLAALLHSAAIPVREVLELGSGGGHNAVHLRADFAMTLVDLSADMLAVSSRLNPECDHRLGDMRTVRLDREFDGVLVHDAADYLLDEDDVRGAAETAYAHCRPGGVAVFVPDVTAETPRPSTEHGGSDGPDGRGARFLSWTWDPDPDDTWTQTEYAVLLRSADGSVQVVHDTHRTGLFGRADWQRLLSGVGFEVAAVVEQTSEDRIPRLLFVGRR